MKPPSGHGMGDLVREAADGLGDLLALHLKLARLELAADLRSFGKQARLIAGLVVLIVVGYALGMVGIAACIGGSGEVARMGNALIVIGAIHVAGGIAGVFAVRARLSAKPVMDVTAVEVARSFDALNPTTPSHPLPAARQHSKANVDVQQ